MVVARDNQYAAVRRTTVRIAMLECVAGSINTGSFAVPNAEDAIDWLLQQALLSKDGLPTFTLRA